MLRVPLVKNQNLPPRSAISSYYQPMLNRPATPEDVPTACDIIRRSITELCTADHANDPAILQRWLANKTPKTSSPGSPIPATPSWLPLKTTPSSPSVQLPTTARSPLTTSPPIAETVHPITGAHY
jgi:hypothetical protein